jgi:predicted nucleic acid-binding protein
VKFVDTSFWVALQFARDEHHTAARELWQIARAPLFTTNHVVGETWTFLRRRAGHTAAWRFVDAVTRSPRLAIEHVSEAVESEAWDWLQRHDERPYSFVDATSFASMRRRRLTEALAFDGDFRAAGFVELRP